jgi:hypothetical protein
MAVERQRRAFGTVFNDSVHAVQFFYRIGAEIKPDDCPCGDDVRGIPAFAKNGVKPYVRGKTFAARIYKVKKLAGSR